MNTIQIEVASIKATAKAKTLLASIAMTMPLAFEGKVITFKAENAQQQNDVVIPLIEAGISHKVSVIAKRNTQRKPGAGAGRKATSFGHLLGSMSGTIDQLLIDGKHSTFNAISEAVAATHKSTPALVAKKVHDHLRWLKTGKARTTNKQQIALSVKLASAVSMTS